MDKDAIWGDYLCGKKHSITTTVSHPGHLNFLPEPTRTSSDDASVLALASAATATASSTSVGSNKRRLASGEYSGETKSS